MTLTVVRIARRWRYESDFPVGTPNTCTHLIHVPDQIIGSSHKGEQRYRIQPHSANLVDRPLTARQLLKLAHLRICSEIYVHTTII